MEDKKCGNCRYFLNHYIKTANGFRPIAVGHCHNYELSLKDKQKCFKFETACEHWEEMTLQVEERKEKIVVLLRGMANNLAKIMEVIEDDYKK